MNNKQTENLMKVLLGISALLILAGALFKQEHYPHGNLMLWIGLISSITLSSFVIHWLRKIIKNLENNNRTS